MSEPTPDVVPVEPKASPLTSEGSALKPLFVSLCQFEPLLYSNPSKSVLWRIYPSAAVGRCAAVPFGTPIASVLAAKSIVTNGVSSFMPNFAGDSLVIVKPQLNKLYINIADSTKTAITIKANIRGYATASGVNNLIIEVLSKIATVLDIQKPYKQEIHHLVIGPETTPRRMDYAMKINGAILTQIYDVRTQGARIAAVTDYDDGIAGGTLTFRDCYFTRAKFGILFPQGTGFTMVGGAFENIDSVAIYSTNSFTLRDLYTENTPLGSVGSLISSPADGGVDFIRLYNVTANGGAACATGDCAIFKGGARGVTYTGGFLNQFAKIIATPDSSNYWLLQDLHSLNPTSDTTGLTAHPNVTLTGYYRVSGGTMQSAINLLKGKYKIEQLADNANATGSANQFLRANGNNTWSWANILPNQLDAQGAVVDDVLTWDGVEWIPQAAPTPPNEIPTSVSGRLVRYNSATTVDGEPNLFWDAVNNRLGVGLTTPTRLLSLYNSANSYLRVSGDNNGGIELQMAASSPNAAWDTYAARGSVAVPTAIQYGNTLGQFRFYGHDGTDYRLTAAIVVKSTINTTSNNVPSDMIFSVRRNGFGGQSERVWFKSRGYVGIGTSTPSGYLTVKSDDGTRALLTLINSASDSTSIYAKATTPEASTTATQGSITATTDGNMYIKHSGTGNTGWLLVDKVIKGTATLDFPSTNNHESSDLTVTVTGAAVGDFADVTPLVNPPVNSHYTATVTAANTVTVRFNHYGTTGATDPTSQDFRIIIHKY